jgi:hypothetical protein
MNQILEELDSLYTSTIMRDFLTKVIPGSIILFTLTLPIYDTKEYIKTLSELSIWLWILLFGICIVIGNSIQAIAEFLGWSRWYLKDYDKKESEDKAKQRIIKFYAYNKVPMILKTHERYVIIKDFSANVSLSILISIGIYLFDYLFPTGEQYILGSLLLLMVISLKWYHQINTIRQQDFEINSIKEIELIDLSKNILAEATQTEAKSSKDN